MEKDKDEKDGEEKDKEEKDKEEKEEKDGEEKDEEEKDEEERTSLTRCHQVQRDIFRFGLQYKDLNAVSNHSNGCDGLFP